MSTHGLYSFSPLRASRSARSARVITARALCTARIASRSAAVISRPSASSHGSAAPPSPVEVSAIASNTSRVHPPEPPVPW